VWPSLSVQALSMLKIACVLSTERIASLTVCVISHRR
jgi:hypothetical protein